jgi:MFS family permease
MSLLEQDQTDEQKGKSVKTEKKLPPLWHSTNFLKFWLGQSVSKFGDQFSLLALPLLILALTPSPFALGIAEAANLVPYLLLGLPAGALIDRLPRRIVMIVCDIARTLIFAALSVSLLAGWLNSATIWVIYLAIAAASVATIFFDMAYLTAAPAIVSPEQLLTANSALQASESTAQFAGPPLAGIIFQALGAAYALLGDALSFIVSVISLALIPHNFRAADPSANTSPAKTSLWREIGEGLRFVWKQPVLRWAMLLIAVSNFCSNAAFPLWLFRARDQLHYNAGLIGLILACLAAGGIAGSFIAGRFRQWFGMLPTALVAMLIEGLAYSTFAYFSVPWLFMVVMALVGLGSVIININMLTLRQSITPDHMMGRMQSVVRVIAWSLIPAGALVGTALAGPLGLAPVIMGASALIFLVALAMFLSPIRKMG